MIVGRRVLTVITCLTEEATPLALTAVIVFVLTVPPIVGVPEITPVVGFRDSPAGKLLPRVYEVG